MDRRPRLSYYGRQLLIQRLQSGRTASVVAEELGVSRATVYKWRRRFDLQGVDGLEDRPSRPVRSPHRLGSDVEAEIVRLRRERKLGPHRLAALTGKPRSTCYKVLRRHGLHRLDWMDRPTGRVVRRYEWERPGQLVHVDVKKLGRIPEGGGHRTRGRLAARSGKKAVGYDYIHSLVDDHSRFAYSEVLTDERVTTCAGFLRRAGQVLASLGIGVERVMTDNAFAYRYGYEFHTVVAELGARQVFTPFYRPQVNGKAERYNRTLLEEWAYVQPYSGNAERAALLPEWLHMYNHHRAHTALGGLPPVSRVNNVSGNYI